MVKIGIFNQYGPEYLLTFSQRQKDLAVLIKTLEDNTAFTHLTEVGTGKGIRFRSTASVANIKTILMTKAKLQPSDYILVTGQFFGMPLD